MNSDINLLLFSMNGVNFGVDMEEVGRIVEPRSIHPSILCYSLENFFDFPVAPSQERRKGVFLFPKHYESQCAIRIEGLESMVLLPLDSIRALPRILRWNLDSQPVWGVAIIEEHLVFLVSLDRLLARAGDPILKPFRQGNLVSS
ncbi:MAG: hypothetical protein HQL07_02130 [Nitrospirae bacterium]|nr:hypothetical protein [Magnetococcales bacterium]